MAILLSNIPDKISSLSEPPPSSTISRYLKALQSEVKAGHLKKQLEKWILEDRSKDKDFSYRLTGKDSKLVFMFLVDAIKGDSENPKLQMKLICIVFIAIKLRDCASRFSMYHITPPDVQEVQKMRHDYFTAVVLVTDKVSATVWSIGHLAPVHT